MPTTIRQTRGYRTARSFGLLLAGAGLAAVVFIDPLHLHGLDEWLRGDNRQAATTTPETEQLWTCGMHPQVIQDHPGTCPICHMDLVPLKSAAEPAAVDTDHAHHLYTCPMHPDIVEEQPGSCPICGMDLVPVDADPPPAAPAAAQAHDEETSRGSGRILFYRNPMDPTITSPVPRKDDMGMDYVPVYADSARPSDGATVTIDPAVVQNMNVETATTTRTTVSHRIRTVGYLDYDEERMVSVTTKYAGYVEKAYVNHLGQPIGKGQPLFDIYSPELVQTQQELLSAVSYAASMSTAPADARHRAESLVAAARERLSYWDITSAQIEALEKRGEVTRTLTVYAPSSGVVMQRPMGLEGMAVKPGMELLHIAGLDTLWLRVEVYENQISWLHVGSEATVTLTYFPGETFRGRVRYVEPEVSAKARTVGLTLELPNPGRRLRVGMYATVVFEPAAARDVVAVPTNAVLRTGLRDIVIVAMGGGRFAPRQVTLGAQGDGKVEILHGLDAGEEVVTSAQFLIDSESNLQEAIQKMVAARREAAGGHDAH